MKRQALRSAVLLALLLFTGAWPSALAQPDTFSYRIDPDLAPALPELPGIGGGPERPVGAVLEPDGVRGDYVVDEVILHGPTGGQLTAFVDAYEAELIFDADLPGDPGNLPPDKLRPAFSTTDDYLLRVNLDLADTTEFEHWMEQQGYEGEYAFSSDEAMRVVAIVAKEQEVNDLSISLNPLMLPPEQPAELSARLRGAVGGGSAVAAPEAASAGSADCVMCRTEEYAVTGGYANGFAFSWLNDADLKATRAWQYYELLELTPSSYPVLGMVDFGFSLNADFPSNVPQYDFETESYTTSGNANTLPSGGTWHGTGTLGLAAARLNNRFGTAGTGGQVAFPYLFRPEGTLYGVALAIRTAVYWGADVVNVSTSAEGASLFKWLALTKASDKAASAGAIVLVTAGNNGADGSKYYPCNTPGFLCVGGIDMSTKQAASGSNYGSKVEVWGPYNGLQTTPNPDSGGNLATFGGTCGASAYMAGVVTLMRAVSPTLTYQGARDLLIRTANGSTDPKLAATGYPNVYAAVAAAAESAGLSPQDDAYEPNDTPAAATALAQGVLTATIGPEDADHYAFTTTDLMDVALGVVYDERAALGNGLVARLDGGWGTASGGSITLDQTYLPPGTHVLEVRGAYTDTVNCYHVHLSTAPSSIAPDEYDDQTPAGEPRNDTWANRAAIPGTVQDSILAPKGQIADLNFDVQNDDDFFEVTLEPAVDPGTGQSECIAPSHPNYGDAGFSQGMLEISAWPDVWKPSTPGYTAPFQVTVYTGTGSVFTSTTGLRLAFECPHQHFPDGKIRFSIEGQGGGRNFYRAFIHYARWDVYYDIPDWVWTLTEPPLLRVLPPWAGLIPQRFPRDFAVIAQWAAGTPPDPMPPDYAAFHWGGGDLDLYLLTQGGGDMGMTMFNAAGDEIGTLGSGDPPGPDALAVGDMERLHVPDLEAGTYVLAFAGDFGAAYAVSIGPPYLLYMPLVVRE